MTDQLLSDPRRADSFPDPTQTGVSPNQPEWTVQSHPSYVQTYWPQSSVPWLPVHQEWAAAAQQWGPPSGQPYRPDQYHNSPYAAPFQTAQPYQTDQYHSSLYAAPFQTGQPFYPEATPPAKPRAKSKAPALVALVMIISIVLVGIGLFNGTGLLPNLAGTPSPSQPPATDSQGYQNTGYRPPSIATSPYAFPDPATAAEREKYLTANALYQQTVPAPTNCPIGNLSPRSMTAEQLEAVMNEFTACLMRVWDLSLESAGYNLPRPEIVVYTTPINTPCGKTKDYNANFCTADQKIYFDHAMLEFYPKAIRDYPYITEYILAHEFAHAIQTQSGILAAEHYQQEAARTKAEANVWSRRLESQADCLSGMFVGSVLKSRGLTSTDLKNLRSAVRMSGDDIASGDDNVDGEHGLSDTREAWFSAGLQSTAIGTCNTFVVPASQVR